MDSSNFWHFINNEGPYFIETIWIMCHDLWPAEVGDPWNPKNHQISSSVPSYLKVVQNLNFKSYGTRPIIIFTPGINSFISSNNHMTFWRCNITCFSTNFTDFVPIIIYLFIHVSIIFLFRYLMLRPTLLDFCTSNLTVNKGIRSVWPLDYLIPVRINWFLTILTTDKPIRDEGKNSSLKVCKSIW